MDALEQLRGAIPDAAKDIRLNLRAVLRGESLSKPQRWGVAAAAAVAARHGLRMTGSCSPPPTGPTSS